MKNNLPNWLNYVLIGIIFLLLIVGAIPILQPEFVIDPSKGMLNNFHTLLPSVFTFFVYILTLLASSLFAYDLGTIMSIVFIIGGVFCWLLSINLENETDKLNTISIATALIGFGTGMPVGKALNKTKQNTNQ